MNTPAQVPLIERLRSVPKTASEWIRSGLGQRNVPYGAMLHEAADEIKRMGDWIERLQKTTQTLTCVYCGKEYPPGSPAHGSSVLTEHIKVCEKHPMRAAEASVVIANRSADDQMRQKREAQAKYKALLSAVAELCGWSHHPVDEGSGRTYWRNNEDSTMGTFDNVEDLPITPDDVFGCLIAWKECRKELEEANGYLKSRVIVGLGDGCFAAVDPWVKNKIEAMQAKLASNPS